MLKKIFGANQLDEMQEQKLAKIESQGLWLAFWLLLGVMIAQSLLGAAPTQMAGEWIVFMILCVYLVAACLRAGLWDRKLKASTATNGVAALISGGAVFVLVFASTYRWSGESPFWVRLLAGAIAGGCTWLLTFGLLQISAVYYRRRRHELDTPPEQDEPDTEKTDKGES